MSVSIVAAPWRALVQAAWWNGNAPHTTTGEAKVSASHCQLVNCSGGIMESSSTGRPRTAETINRSRRLRVGSCSVLAAVARPGTAGSAAE